MDKGNVVAFIKPKNSVSPKVYSADVYSFDMKKYQFEVRAENAEASYFLFLREAINWGVGIIEMIAIYSGGNGERIVKPEKVWFRKKNSNNDLVECLNVV